MLNNNIDPFKNEIFTGRGIKLMWAPRDLSAKDVFDYLDVILEQQKSDKQEHNNCKNLTNNTENDTINTIEYSLMGEHAVRVEFKEHGLVWVYFLCKDIDLVKRGNKRLLVGTPLYENISDLQNLLSKDTKENTVIGKCTIATKYCLDLLDTKSIKWTSKFYKDEVRRKGIPEDINVEHFFMYLVGSTDYKAIRYGKEGIRIKEPKWLNNITGSVIYRVFNTNCISNIEEVRKITIKNK